MTSFPLESLIPNEPARWTLLAAVGTVVGVAISRWPVAGLAVVVVLTAIAVRSHRVIALTAAGFVLAGIASGAVASTRLEATTRKSLQVRLQAGQAPRRRADLVNDGTASDKRCSTT